MNGFRFFLFLFASVIMVSACSTSHKSRRSDYTNPQILFSLNGEPLNGGALGKPTCREAMTHWFDRVDVNHDAGISQDEFLADARAQFKRMDIDRNGYLVPEELERFRQPYRQSSSAEAYSATPDENETPQPAFGSHRHRHGGTSGGGNNANAVAKSGQGDAGIVDPVMSADTNLDNRVTPDEFMTYVQKTFVIHDADHNGALSQAEVLSLCGQNQ